MGVCWADCCAFLASRRFPLPRLRARTRAKCLDRGPLSGPAGPVSRPFEFGPQSGSTPEPAVMRNTDVAPTGRGPSGPRSKGRPTQSVGTTPSRRAPRRGTTLGRNRSERYACRLKAARPGGQDDLQTAFFSGLVKPDAADIATLRIKKLALDPVVR